MKTAVLSAIGLFLLLAIVFKLYQDQAKLGGKIAWSKSFWLQYTLLSWFVLPILLQFSNAGGSFKNLLALLGASMWVRGLAEILMMYKFKNWNPKYGISHDVFTIILLAGAFIFNNQLAFEEVWYLGSVIVSLCLETYYAGFFLIFVGTKTQGDKALWFASKENPLFKNVLRATTAGNFLTWGPLVWFALNLDH